MHSIECTSVMVNALKMPNENVKWYDLINYVGVKMSEQMQEVRERIIDILHRNEVKRASFFWLNRAL
jgi:hypothetical protein